MSRTRLVALLLATIVVGVALGAWAAYEYFSSLRAKPHAAAVPSANKVWRIGYLTPSDLPRSIFIDPLRELGYVEGQSARYEIRSAENDLARLPDLAVDLVRAKVDIIVAVSPPAILAARQATSGIPVVMAAWGGEGLLESGIVASFARPGGNVTGLYMLAAELDAKRLEILLDAVPQARIVGVLNPGPGWSLTHLRRVAESRKIALRVSDMPGPDGYDAAFAAMKQARVDAVLVPSFPRFFFEQLSVIRAAAEYRIPAMYEWGDMARVGGLMAYGPVRADMHRRVALYVHQILTGAQPGDLPVEQPTTFERVVNLKTARDLGLSFPPEFLSRADEVIR
jgi:putative ABC transport system substrate-binding protein